MKKTLLLAVLFLLLGGGTWYVLKYKNTQATHISWDMDFAVPNTGSIGKIFIADREGHTATLERKDDYWLYNGRHPARPTGIDILLETIAKVNVRYIPTEGAKIQMVKNIAAQGLKVEIYDRDGKNLKTYYVGGVTADERGTFMMMDGAEQPYVVHLPTFIGQLRIRYMLGDDNWRDRAVFREKPEEIQSVWVEYPQRKSESFRLEKTGEAQYEVKPFFSTTPVSKTPQRKGMPEAYLVQFESLVAEAFETDNPFRDSVVATLPFVTVTLKKIDGTEKKVRFWPTAVDETLEGVTYVNRYFAEVNGESFMLIQDRVFGPIFRGYDFFFEGVPERKLRN